MTIDHATAAFLSDTLAKREKEKEKEREVFCEVDKTMEDNGYYLFRSR